MTDRTPTTQAGKRLLDNRDFHDPECPRWKAIGSPDAPCSCDLPKAVSTIEAEAARAAVQEYRDGLREAGAALRLAVTMLDRAGVLPVATAPVEAAMRRAETLALDAEAHRG